MIAPNLVEGREFNSPQALALDTSTSPPILYVADTSNNRVLAWKNATGFTTGNFADLVVGQRDLYSVSPQGPGTNLSTGLAEPTAAAVDSSGNLYVADAGNNRILRYPKPFTQNSPLLQVDLIIGQTNLSSNSANQGNSKPSATSLALSTSNGAYRLGLAFDATGNLWVSDAGNNRVLRFPVANLSANTNAPAADLVLGQVQFTTNAIPTGVTAASKTFLSQPSGLAFDSVGRLFVADSANRVSVFVPGFSTGEAASRIMGVIPPTQANPNPPSISAGTLGSTNAPPAGVFFMGNTPFVADTGNARILEYPSFDQWPLESTSFSPVATAVIGQADFTSNKSNQGQAQPSNSSFSGPVGAHTAFETNGVVGGAFAGGSLYVLDSGNNRLMVFPQQSSGTFTTANRLLGQVDFQYNSINLIEGREFFFQGYGGALVIDWKSTPPHLYVSDPGNNRILCYADYRKVAPGVTADMVLGQPDLYTAEINYPQNSPNQLSNQGLYAPEGLALDASGNLWVADTGNGRVLRFPAPFAQTQGSPVLPNLVLGQTSFYQKVTDASSQNMRSPWGVGFTVLGYLLVSDSALNRVLFFQAPTGGDFTNGQLASYVIGQPNFGPPSEAAGPGLLSQPSLLTLDVDDTLYVADTGNNRIVVYHQIPAALGQSGNDPAPSISLTGLNKPYGVFADHNNNQVWVADTANNRLLRYEPFDTLGSSGTTPTFDVSLPSAAPFAVTLDPFDNPVSAEGGYNRVAFFYPEIDNTNAAGGIAGRFSGNAANYFQVFAPSMLASIFAFQNTHFGIQTAGASSVPLPTTLGDVEVFVNGVAAPLLYASPPQINFQVPSSTPAGSTPVEFQVVKASTGQILADSFFQVNPVSPGLFTADSSGSGQLAALNQDGSVNSATNPAKAGTYISLFGTGPGVVSGAPPDGTPAPTDKLLPTSSTPVVYINAVEIPASDINFSGLAPGFIGLWQINVKVPANVPTPGTPVPVALLYDGINSRLDAFGNGRVTTINTTP